MLARNSHKDKKKQRQRAFKTKRATQFRNIKMFNNTLQNKTLQFLDNFTCVDGMFQVFMAALPIISISATHLKKLKIKSSQKVTCITQGILTT